LRKSAGTSPGAMLPRRSSQHTVHLDLAPPLRSIASPKVTPVSRLETTDRHNVIELDSIGLQPYPLTGRPRRIIMWRQAPGAFPPSRSQASPVPAARHGDDQTDTAKTPFGLSGRHREFDTAAVVASQRDRQSWRGHTVPVWSKASRQPQGVQLIGHTAANHCLRDEST